MVLYASEKRCEMMKAICFRDVQPGDVVCEEIGRMLSISEAFLSASGSVSLFNASGSFLSGRPDQIIGRGRRATKKFSSSRRT